MVVGGLLGSLGVYAGANVGVKWGMAKMYGGRKKLKRPEPRDPEIPDDEPQPP